MTIPDWNDTSVKRGTKIRIALWLLREIGEGSVFTKAQLRAAFPGVEQADRRMRDLRDHEWVIDTNKEDSALDPSELRFVKAGEEVWKPGKATPKGTVTISAKERAAIMARDEYMCTVCGITGGEAYPDAQHQTAQLSISRRAGEAGKPRLVTECKRCRAGASAGRMPSPDALLEAIGRLAGPDRAALTSWIRAGRRPATAAEKAWAQYLRLPVEDREAVARQL
ncbi:hypothetical protein AGRA3207_003495 [Actinomadura graeca]|uniref:HNH endonuclease n=1 Tax=Actinomadura graeca TaxID=2750812 RepID=A0ABX8QUM4_9ACTN|nr:hypothetical protein [Actinomadura graeca]QXJ22490.1 hypothetical protein AGRA3207_003495 [Actinomadura graeca]